MELQHISHSGTSHFRTIERQDSFDMGLHPVISCGRVGSVTVVRPQPRTHSLDLGGNAVQTSPLSNERNPHIAHSTPSDLFKSCESSLKADVDATQTPEPTSEEDENQVSPSCPTSVVNGTESRAGVEHVSTLTDKVRTIKSEDTESSDQQQQGAPADQGEHGSTGSAPVSEGDSGIDPCAEGGEEDCAPKAEVGDAGANSSDAATRGEQQGKKKGGCSFF